MSLMSSGPSHLGLVWNENIFGDRQEVALHFELAAILELLERGCPRRLRTPEVVERDVDGDGVASGGDEFKRPLAVA
jgi:hypothetical protein